MTRYLPLVIIVLAVLFFATTGFQCGSAETTSANLYMQQKNGPRAEESLLKEVTKNPTNEEAWAALAVDREAFAAAVTQTIADHPAIEVIWEEVRRFRPAGPSSWHPAR